MLNLLGIAVVVIGLSLAMLVTLDACRRHPVKGPLILAGIALGVAVVSWAAVPECDFYPCYDRMGEAAVAISAFLAHVGLFGLFVIVALVQMLRQPSRGAGLSDPSGDPVTPMHHENSPGRTIADEPLLGAPRDEPE